MLFEASRFSSVAIVAYAGNGSYGASRRSDFRTFVLRFLLVVILCFPAATPADTTAVLYLGGLRFLDNLCPFDVLYATGDDAVKIVAEETGIFAEEYRARTAYDARSATDVLFYDESGNTFFARYPELDLNVYDWSRMPESVVNAPWRFVELKSAWAHWFVSNGMPCNAFLICEPSSRSRAALGHLRFVVDKTKLRTMTKPAEVKCGVRNLPGPFQYDERELFVNVHGDRPKIDRKTLMAHGVAVLETPASFPTENTFCFVRDSSAKFDFDSLLTETVQDWPRWDAALPWREDQRGCAGPEERAEGERTRELDQIEDGLNPAHWILSEPWFVDDGRLPASISSEETPSRPRTRAAEWDCDPAAGEAGGVGILNRPPCATFVPVAETRETNLCVDGHFTDGRDGKAYGCAAIGARTWMTQNLDFGEMVPGGRDQDDASALSAQKYCYDDDERNCAVFGGLYQWHTAMAMPEDCDMDLLACAGVVSSPRRGICPEGWHLPTSMEWTMLQAWVDENNGGSRRDEGVSMRSAAGWRETEWNGTDEYGFHGLPGGRRSEYGPLFSYSGSNGMWWSATAITDESAVGRGLNRGRPQLGTHTVRAIDGLSVRCVKD